jgi:uncharacterized damage-inducible protein DinB
MTETHTNAPLARMFEYNLWANDRVIDACRELKDEQLDAAGENAFGSIRSTLLHLIYGQYSFVARLGGRAQDARSFSPPWPGFEALAAVAAETGEALRAAAAALIEDADVVLAYQAKSYRYHKSFFLTHALAHGTEHRTQVGVMLAQLGHTQPNLDGWEFAAAAGLGVEV